MFKATLKGFYKNWKYIFMVGGIVYLAIILFAYFFIRSLFAICGENISLLFNEIIKIFNGYISNQNLIESLKNVPTFLSTVMAAVSRHLSEFYSAIIAAGMGLLTIAYIIFEFAKSLTIISIGNEELKRNFFWVFISIAIRTVLSLGFTVLIMYLITKWIYSLIFIVIIYLVLKALLNIIYVKLSKRKGTKLKKMFNLHTVLKLIVMYLMAFAITALIAVFLVLVTNMFIAILLIVPIAMYMNAAVEGVSYGMFKICDKVEEQKLSVDSDAV